MIRDRKMYVAPTPFALTTGTTGLRTLIVPAGTEKPGDFVSVGMLEREEAKEMVTGYSFDLTTNALKVERTQNPNAGRLHRFEAVRLQKHGQHVTMSKK